MPKNIHDLLTSWGVSKRQLPEHNETLKSEILKRSDRFSRSSGPTAVRRLPWLSFALASAAVIMLIVQVQPASQLSPSLPPPYGKGEVAEPAGEAVGDSALKRIMPPDYYPYPRLTDVPITDDREFLKMSYNATIRARHPDDQARHVQTIVRAHDGRIDSANISEKYAYVSFVVPAAQFEEFRAEMNTIARAKFITENTSSQNLLPQKQSIEEKQNNVNAELDRVRAERSNLIAVHRRAIANLEAQLAAAQTEEEHTAIRARISAENVSYSRTLASLDVQIRNYEKQLESLNKQDQQLINNVAMVNGTIALNFISVWQIIDLYVGPYWLPIILAIAVLIAYWHNRRQRLMLPV